VTLTEVREAIASGLSDALGVPFIPGRIVGPTTNGDVGCSRSEGDETNGDNENFVLAHIVARVLVNYDVPVEAESPPDPAVLEDLRQQIRASLSPLVLGQDSSAWFYRVASVEINLDEWCVDAHVVVELQNDFDLG